MDALQELIKLRDMVRETVEHFENLDLSPDQAELLDERRKIIKEIEANINRLRGLH